MSQSNCLKIGATLQNGKFVIRRVLGQGGFGITYEAEQTNMNKVVVLKELFISSSCERKKDGNTVYVLQNNQDFFDSQKKRFVKEAERMGNLPNSHIVQVHDNFEENGTAYYVMDFIEGKSLADILIKEGKPFDEGSVRFILEQMLDALECIHGKTPPLCHLDIKPANIMMDSMGKALLIDFGASKYVATSDNTISSSTAIAYTPGYAPIEQLSGNRDIMGPWTDFYALGATLFNLLTRQKPSDPSIICNDRSPQKRESIPLPANITTQMRQLILWLMKTDIKDRPQSVEEIRKFLKGTIDLPKSTGHQNQTNTIRNPKGATGNVSSATAKSPNPSTPASRHKWKKWAGYALAIALLLFIGWGIGKIGSKQETNYRDQWKQNSSEVQEKTYSEKEKEYEKEPPQKATSDYEKSEEVKKQTSDYYEDKIYEDQEEDYSSSSSYSSSPSSSSSSSSSSYSSSPSSSSSSSSSYSNSSSSSSSSSTSSSSTKTKHKCIMCEGTGKCQACYGIGVDCIACNQTGKCISCYGTGESTLMIHQ